MQKMSKVGVVAMSLACAVMPSLNLGCSKESTPSAPPPPAMPAKSAHLGRAGDANFSTIEIEGKVYLYADGNESCALHLLSVEPGQPIAFSAREVAEKPETPQGVFFVVTVNEERFLFVDSVSACDLKPLPRAENVGLETERAPASTAKDLAK